MVVVANRNESAAFEHLEEASIVPTFSAISSILLNITKAAWLWNRTKAANGLWVARRIMRTSDIRKVNVLYHEFKSEPQKAGEHYVSRLFRSNWRYASNDDDVAAPIFTLPLLPNVNRPASNSRWRSALSAISLQDMSFSPFLAGTRCAASSASSVCSPVMTQLRLSAARMIFLNCAYRRDLQYRSRGLSWLCPRPLASQRTFSGRLVPNRNHLQ